MNIRAYSFLLALAVAPFVACGDDDSSGPENVPVDSSVDPVGAGDAGSARDAATPGDAAIASDAAVPGSDASALDAGPRDGGSRDSAVADSGRVDSGAATVADSGPSTGPVDSGGGVVTPSGPGESAACLQCEKKYCAKSQYYFTRPDSNPIAEPVDLTTRCEKLEGVATDGPKKGTARSKLCTDLVSCARRTGCADPLFLGCLCGAQEFATCQAAEVSTLPGLCRAEMLAAAETVEWQELAGRLSGSGFLIQLDGTVADSAIGSAAGLFECSVPYCIDECYAPCAGKADGTSCRKDNMASKCEMNSCPREDTLFQCAERPEGMCLPAENFSGM